MPISYKKDHKDNDIDSNNKNGNNGNNDHNGGFRKILTRNNNDNTEGNEVVDDNYDKEE